MTENIKDSILKAAHTLFARKGVRVVAVSDVCRELGMSKKTFYQYYASKEDLVSDIVEIDFQTRREVLAKVVSEHDPIEAMVLLENKIDDSKISEDDNRMTEDIKKYYPDTFKKTARMRRLSIRTIIMSSLEDGVRLGYYNPDLNMDSFFMMNVFLFSGLKSMCDERASDRVEGFDCNSFLEDMRPILHHALFTPKGWDRYNYLTGVHSSDSEQ